MQFFAVAIDTEIDLKIERAEHDAATPAAPRTAASRLAKPRAVSTIGNTLNVGMRVSQHRLDLLARLRLRQHDAGDTRMRRQRGDVLVEPARIRAVDPHPRRPRCSAPHTSDEHRRARAGFSSGCTASSRSRITASAPAACAFSKRSGRLPGTNRYERGSTALMRPPSRWLCVKDRLRPAPAPQSAMRCSSNRARLVFSGRAGKRRQPMQLGRDLITRQRIARIAFRFIDAALNVRPSVRRRPSPCRSSAPDRRQSTSASNAISTLSRKAAIASASKPCSNSVTPA